MAPANKFCLFVLAAAVAAAGTSLYTPTSAEVTMDSSTATAARLYGQIAGSKDMHTTPNFVFSPFSIFIVFQSAQKGAAGETKAEMDALVGPDESFTLPELRQPSYRRKDVVAVKVANRLYVDSALDKNEKFQEYKELLEKEGGAAETLDFVDSAAAAAKINAFVKCRTRGHITHLIDASDLDADTRLVLVNALYFKAPWLEQFKKEDTELGSFTTPSGSKEVPFMSGKMTKAPILITKKDGVSAVALPYSDSRLRLYVFMPENLQSFESNIVDDPNILEDLITDMELTALEKAFEEEIHIKMPKFKLAAEENKLDLAKLFRSLGATNMFDRGKADFSGITGNKDLFVSSFVHQADIDVNEDGTEATAGTGMMMTMRMMPAPKKPIYVVINKPFLFQLRFVYGENNFILFNGRLADPTAAQ